MISLRKGPKILFFRTENPDIMTKELVDREIATMVSLQEGIKDSDEKSSLLFVTDLNSVNTKVEDAKHTLLSPYNGSKVLAEVINLKMSKQLEKVEMGTRSLVMRIPGNAEKIIEAIKDDFGGKHVTWREGVEIGRENQSLVWLTNKPLMTRLTEEDLLGDHLLINKSTDQLFEEMGRKVLRYISHSMETQNWYEYRINIYDSYGDYDKHYKRLMHVITSLEMGYILGENWTKDHALALLSVVAYQIRLFSFMPPPEMKAVLMGLEYDETGKRLVDLDLYHRNTKVGWMEARKFQSEKKRSKKEEGIFRHVQLIEKLRNEI
ncbi:hypothetical protein [Tindallia californiensis]|uniref:Uncharacterized protein n=1 Tax=Tindallia californiensis TaxID=159292 RepID=A0A1H3MT10_9FIRM|nr:hypothetical protein [Tindallia californiensis]SDY79693.1 hypothetical protein SAMN05192546_104264 [Tindallia californiensis]